MKVWSQKAADAAKKEILSLPEKERMEVAEHIKKDLKGWAMRNFKLTSNQQKCLEMIPDIYWEETGCLLSRAIEKKHELEISVTDAEVPVEKRTRNDYVEAGWEKEKGFYAKYVFKF